MTIPESQPVVDHGSTGTRTRRPATLAAATCIALAVLSLVVVLLRPTGDPQILWQDAQNALQSGDFKTADAKLTAIARLRAPTGLDWSLRAQIAVANSRADDALAALSHIPETDPLSAQAFLFAGRIERQRNRIPAAEAYFRKALAADAKSIDAHKELIFIYGMQLRRKEVDAEFKALAHLKPLSHHELLTWGLTHFTVFVEHSAEQLEAFIQADPADRFSRLSLANTCMKSPEMDSRVDAILEPLTASDPAAASLRIELRLRQGRIDEAMNLLDAARGDDPSFARIRGKIALMRHDTQSAIGYFRAALSEEPYDRVALTELGKSLLLSGDKAGAETYLTRAKRLDDVYDLLNWVRQADRENQPHDLIQFGRAFESAHLIDEARGWYLLAVARDPLNAEAQQALRRLRDAGPL